MTRQEIIDGLKRHEEALMIATKYWYEKIGIADKAEKSLQDAGMFSVAELFREAIQLLEKENEPPVSVAAKWESGDPMTRDEIIKALREFIHQFDGRDVGDYFVEDVLEAAADMLEQDAPRWISVKDRLPPYGRYLVTVEKEDMPITVHTAVYNDLGWWTHLNVGEITHWMPLPEPPKEDDK